MKKSFSILLSLCLLTVILAACSQKDNGNNASSSPAASSSASPSASASATPEKLDPVKLKIMIPGDRPKDFDTVVAEAEKGMADTLNVKLDVVFIPWADLAQKTQVTLSSGEDVDLIFEAPWLHMSQMIAADYYEPLDDLLKQYGPNIISTRSEQMINANKFNGKIMAVPLGNSFYQGRVYYVRKDIREELGVPEIKSYEDLIKFAYLVKEKKPDVTPLIAKDAGMTWAQFRKVFDYETTIKDTQLGTDGVLYHKNNDGKVYNMFYEKDPTFWSWITDARKLYTDKLMYQDVLSVKDYRELYKAGKIAIMNTNDFGVLSDIQSAVKQSVGGEVEAVTFFSTEKGANVTDFKVWNFLALTSVSKNKERAIQFLDWASQKDNYDLLAYGIQGQNWEPVGDDKYKKLNDGYPWFPFAWIWNPQNDRFDEALGDETIALNKFTGVADNFTSDILTGFTFDSAPVANEIAQFNSIRDKYMNSLGNGVVDPETTFEKFKSEASGVAKKIQEEMQKQIDAFLASKK